MLPYGSPHCSIDSLILTFYTHTFDYTLKFCILLEKQIFTIRVHRMFCMDKYRSFATIFIFLYDFQQTIRIQHVFISQGSLHRRIYNNRLWQFRETYRYHSFTITISCRLNIQVRLIDLNYSTAIIEKNIQRLKNCRFTYIISAN